MSDADTRQTLIASFDMLDGAEVAFTESQDSGLRKSALIGVLAAM
ncbi:hypothetical protein [Gemmatimonas sp.]